MNILCLGLVFESLGFCLGRLIVVATRNISKFEQGDGMFFLIHIRSPIRASVYADNTVAYMYNAQS